MHCFTCGGRGFKDKDCPECGKEKVTKRVVKQIAQKPVITENKNPIIPEPYYSTGWDGDVLQRNYPEKAKSDLVFKRFVSQLEKIIGIFYDKRIPSKSAIIIAPPKFSKVTFAYSCMRLAQDNGFSVAPLLDSQEVKRLIVLAAEKPNQTLYGISYEDYINSDVVFITVTKTPYREEAYSIIQEMLDKRSRRGLPTFFITRYSLQTMSKRDWSGSFDAIKDPENTENSLKYPAIISYWSLDEPVRKGE